MIMGPGQQELTGRRAVGFIAPKFPLPQLSLPVNVSFLEATAQDVQKLHENAVRAGYTCVGFHGCGSVAAVSILKGVRDVSVTNARGKGFMVGSLRSGIPSIWSRQAKGGGRPTILKIYVKNWASKTMGIDYDGGKMDSDDDIESCGLEMVLKTGIFSDVLALPSLLPNDQALVRNNVWSEIPDHSFDPDQVPVMLRVAQYLDMTLNQLDHAIENDRERVKKAFEALNIPV